MEGIAREGFDLGRLELEVNHAYCRWEERKAVDLVWRRLPDSDYSHRRLRDYSRHSVELESRTSNNRLVSKSYYSRLLTFAGRIYLLDTGRSDVKRRRRLDKSIKFWHPCPALTISPLTGYARTYISLLRLDTLQVDILPTCRRRLNHRS